MISKKFSTNYQLQFVNNTETIDFVDVSEKDI